MIRHLFMGRIIVLVLIPDELVHTRARVSERKLALELLNKCTQLVYMSHKH